MKSARDITNMAATNRQAVYRYIKKHHIKEKTLDETGKRLYDDETAQKIVAALSKRQPRTGARVEFQTIKEQLNIKDEQLKTLNETIKNLNTSIQELNRELAFEKQSAICRQNRNSNKYIYDKCLASAFYRII